MDTQKKKLLTMEGRCDKPAVAARFKAARLFVGLSQRQLGEIVGLQHAQISNVERAISYPSWNLLNFFHYEHRVGVGFLVVGEYSQLPMDVSEGLMTALSNREGHSHP